MSDVTLTPVYLIGAAGQAAGIEREEWTLDVRSPAEAIRAIDILTGGALSRYLRGPAAQRWYRVAVQEPDRLIDPNTSLTHRSGRGAIYIMPVIRGRNSGVGKIITGAALIALSFINPGLGAAGFKIWAGVTLAFGTSLVLGGISQLLTPPARLAPTDNATEQAQSTSFQGNSSAVVQGGCIPVVYGRALVPGLPVSISINNDFVTTTAAGSINTLDPTTVNGGGVENTSTQDQ